MMQEVDDSALLRDYVERDSEEAFAALVRRHIDRVYSVAVRHTGNPHQAEEITQAVFIILARKARGLRRGVILEGWLYQTARLTSVTHVRSEIRRARREQKAHMQTIPDENESDAWSQITPLLDGALAGLNETDRNAVVLRFFYGKSMREIGAALGGSEDAVRMRINRALERLREYFLKRGVSSTTAAIAGAISANSVQAAPATLAKIATAAALTKGAAASISTVMVAKGALKAMAWTKVQTTIAGAVIIGMAAYSLLEHQAQTRLREQNETLQRRMAGLQAENERLAIGSRPVIPHLPAPPIVASTTSAPIEDLPSTNLYNRFKDKEPLLSAAQVDAFLQANGRKASSLLAAYRTSGDVGLLREAMGKYPNDPTVAFEVLCASKISAEEKQPWLAAFEQAAPDNALANYLSAIDLFKSGQSDRAIQEMAKAAGKTFDDYSLSRMQDDAEAYLSAGYSTAEAQVISSHWLLMQQLSPLKQLGQQMVDLANAYNQAGDPASAQAALEMAMNLGQSLRNAPSSTPILISQLVGMAIQNRALGAMDPNSVYGGSGQTVQAMMDQIAQTKTTIHNINEQAMPLMASLTDQDMINFTTRRMLFGEVPAMQWVVSKFGQQ